MTTSVTKAEVQKLIAEAKEPLNIRITELSKRCNLIESETKGDTASIATLEREIAEVQAKIAKLEAEEAPPAPPAPEPDPEPTPAPVKSGALGTFRFAIAMPVSPITHPNDIVVCNKWDAKTIAEAKKIGARVLVYCNSTRAQEPTAKGEYNSGVTLAQAKAIGAATSVFASEAQGYVCKPGTKGYAALWVETAAAAAHAVGADGIFLDDYNVAGGFEGVNVTNAEMEAFGKVVGPSLKAAGLLAIPNLTGCIGQHDYEDNGWCEAQFAWFDGAADEFFATWGAGSLMSSAYIERATAIMQRQTAKGKLYLAAVNGTGAPVTYGLAEILLHMEGGNARFFTTQENYSTENWPASLEAALKLGSPTGPASATSRTFEHGSVKVSGTTGTITAA